MRRRRRKRRRRRDGNQNHHSTTTSLEHRSIDLHGWTYQEVQDKLLSDVVMLDLEGVSPIHIITGNSEGMKTLVKKILKDWNVEPTPNSGMLSVR